MFERILEGVEYYPARYCVTSTFGTYLKYYGVDFFADMVGRIWDFKFEYDMPVNFFTERDESYYVSPVVKPYFRILQEDFGVAFKNLNVENHMKSLIETCRLAIKQSYPVIVSVDPYYLRHYENYCNYHGLNWNHYIIVYGYSDILKKIYFIDSTRAFVSGTKHEMDYEEFYSAVFPEHNIYCLAHELVLMEPPDENKLGLDLGKLYAFSANNMAAGRLNRTYTGIEGLKEFAFELRNIAAIRSTEQQKYILGQILNQIVLVCQHRRGSIEYIKKHLHHEDKNLEKIAKSWEKIKYSLSPLRKKEHQKRFSDAADYVYEVALAEGDVIGEFVAKCQ